MASPRFWPNTSSRRAAGRRASMRIPALSLRGDISLHRHPLCRDPAPVLRQLHWNASRSARVRPCDRRFPTIGCLGKNGPSHVNANNCVAVVPIGPWSNSAPACELTRSSPGSLRRTRPQSTRTWWCRPLKAKGNRPQFQVLDDGFIAPSGPPVVTAAPVKTGDRRHLPLQEGDNAWRSARKLRSERYRRGEKPPASRPKLAAPSARRPKALQRVRRRMHGSSPRLA